jgi:hypothetical protein
VCIEVVVEPLFTPVVPVYERNNFNKFVFYGHT